MRPYPKIATVYKRDERGKILLNEFSRPEFEYLKDNYWEIEEKIDGTNIRIGWDGHKITIGGRTDNAQIPTFLLNKLNELLPPEKLAKVFPWDEEDEEHTLNVVLYGEGFGARIQKGGGNYLKDDVGFALFDVWAGGLWLTRLSVQDIATTLGLHAPASLMLGQLSELERLCRNRFESSFGPFTAEGAIARPEGGFLDRRGQRIITKLKCRDLEGL